MSRPFTGFSTPEAPPAGVSAILGPTNTGKTHVAIEQLLRYDSGMIGLPLRLLAREVYDRLTQRVGEQQVALITGEERRSPPGARYLVCTVEAMPLAHPVDMLVVDEIQLAGDRGRGHSFTDRLLHARGTRATLFLGSDTIAPAVRRLIPEASITTQPRLSKLTHTGFCKLGALPPKSAIVAFSADAVYALAERARRKHGGCAVVLGALSPRTRNAQVAMFQSGEVPVLVATDAIGMGLNLDLEHVAFAALHKFDGERIRRLQPSELAQIAGRAGRYQTDGTFGTTEASDPLDTAMIDAIESHQLPPLRKLYWRAARLDFTSLTALRDSLLAPPPALGVQLERTETDEDEVSFAILARHPEVRARATHPNRVALLWEVCRTPDYRKQLPETHAELLLRVYLRLVDHGSLAEGWVRRSMESLDRIDTSGEDGDPAGIDTLTQRLAWIRTWAYLTHRTDWVDNARSLREYAAEVENRLSDALHAELQARFVDRRSMVTLSAPTSVVQGGEVRLGGRVVGVLDGIGFRSAEAQHRGGGAAAVRAAVEPAVAQRVVALLADAGEHFRLGDDLTLQWRGESVARLLPGPVPAEPRLKLLRGDWLRPSDRMQVERRLAAILRDRVADVLAPLRESATQRGGVRYLLEAGLGTVPLERVTSARESLSEHERRSLAHHGVRFGAQWAFSIQVTHPGRRVLAAVAAGFDAVPDVLRADPIPNVVFAGSIAAPFWPPFGFIRLGAHAVRVDLYEAWTAEVRRLSRSGSFKAPAEMVERLGDVGPALRELGMTEANGLWIRWRR